jgi:hypothetical protein
MMFKGQTRTGLKKDRGAALVEFAIVLPLLIVLLFGIMEASWAFAQVNDVRHGAREGARLAAVDFGTTAAIRTEVCDRMDRTGASTITVTLDTVSGGAYRGGTAEIGVDLTYSSLTGVLDTIFGGSVFTTDIEFRLEQPIDPALASWVGDKGTAPCV